MITIGRLRLTLPAGYAGRADAVVRRLAEELAARPAAGPRRSDRLTLPPIAADPAAGDEELARRIAAAVHARLGAPSDEGGERR